MLSVTEFTRRFERIAEVMGVSAQPFVDLHKDKVDEMKRNLMDYVKDLRQTGSNNKIAAVRPSDASPEEWEIKLNALGYPRLPSTGRMRDLRKATLDNMLR